MMLYSSSRNDSETKTLLCKETTRHFCQVLNYNKMLRTHCMPANCETGTRSPELTGWALSVTSYEFRIIFPRMYVFVGIKMYVSS